jgi:hypothetical protein
MIVKYNQIKKLITECITDNIFFNMLKECFLHLIYYSLSTDRKLRVVKGRIGVIDKCGNDKKEINPDAFIRYERTLK